MNAKLGQSPIALAISFIDCINRGDVEGLAALMHPEHELRIFDEPPTTGREANVPGWQGYASAYPEYLILPSRIAEKGNVAAVLGTTTGSHLGLPDEEERKLTLIWLCEAADGLVRRWTLIEDTSANRTAYGLDA